MFAIAGAALATMEPSVEAREQVTSARACTNCKLQSATKRVQEINPLAFTFHSDVCRRRSHANTPLTRVCSQVALAAARIAVAAASIAAAAATAAAFAGVVVVDVHCAAATRRLYAKRSCDRRRVLSTRRLL